MEKGRSVEFETQRVLRRPFDPVVSLFARHPETWLPGLARRHRGPVFTRQLPGPLGRRVVQLSLGDAWSHDGGAHRSVRVRRTGAAPLSGTVSVHPGDGPRTCTIRLVVQSEEQALPWQRWMTSLAYGDAIVTLADGLAARFAGLIDEGGVLPPPSPQTAAPGHATSTPLDRLPSRDLTRQSLAEEDGGSHG